MVNFQDEVKELLNIFNERTDAYEHVAKYESFRSKMIKLHGYETFKLILKQAVSLANSTDYKFQKF